LREPLQHALSKHSGDTVLVDSNLLLLWFVGLFKRELIGTYKRLTMFSPEDFDLLSEFLRNFRGIVTTPNILTEVSNLAGALSDHIKPQYFGAFSRSLKLVREEYVSSDKATTNELFQWLGLTDAVIATIALDRVLVITSDFELYYRLRAIDLDAINFNHDRFLA